jgi:chromosome segregation ATPase
VSTSRLIGALFVERGLITEEQLERALEVQSTEGGRLGEIVVAEFGVSRVELASALAEQWAEVERTVRSEELEALEDGAPSPEPPSSDDIPIVPIRRPLGEIFVERGLVSEAQLDAALVEQRESGGKLGEILVEQGVLSRLDLAGALADQWAGLQKLRPPDPKPIEPWQQVAPLELAASTTPPSHDDEAGATLADLEARVSATENAIAADRSHDELHVAADALGARIASLEARLDGIASHDDRTALEALQSGLAELRERLSGPESRIAAVEERLGGVVTGQQLDERLAASVAELESKLVSLESSRPALEAVEAIRVELVALQHLLDERPAADERLSHEIGGLVERLDGVEERLAATAGNLDERAAEATGLLRALSDRIATVEQRLTEIAAAEETGASAVAERLGESVDTIRAELDGVRELAVARNPEHTAAIADLARRVEALAADQDSRAGDSELGPVVEGLRRQTAELEARLDDAASTPIVQEADIAALRTEIAFARKLADDLAAGQREIEKLTRRVEELSERSEQGGQSEELARIAFDVRSQISQLAAQVRDVSTSAPWAAEIEALRAELAEVTPADADAHQERIDELSARLDALTTRADDGLSREDFERLAFDQRERLQQTSARLEQAARKQGDATASRIAGIESRLETAVESSDELAATMAELRRRLETIPTEPPGPTSADLAQQRAEIETLAATAGDAANIARQARDASTDASRTATELSGRIDALSEHSPHRSDLDALAARIDALERATADDGVANRERIDELAAAVDAAGEQQRSELSALREQTAALGDRLSAGATRDEVANVGEELREQITDLAARLAASAAAQDAQRDEITTAALDASRALEDRVTAALDSGAAELAGLRAEIDSRSDATGVRLDDLAAALDDRVRAVLDSDAAGLAGLRAEMESRSDATGVRLDELAAALDEVRSGAQRAEPMEALEELQRLSERMAAIEAGVEGGLDAAEARWAAAAAEAADLRAAADRNAERLHEMQSELAAALDDHERRTREQLAELETKVPSGSDRVPESLTRQMEQIEQALADADPHAMGIRLEALEGRLTDGDAVLQEHVRTTEKALRKGLAALGRRIAESEGAYAEAGDALRRSVERLGYAIAEADVRIAERDDPTAVELHAASATAHVAFAPTQEGYRLLALDGPAPEVGGEVELDGRTLRCTRVGTSPLPLDPRPCAYLEPAA